MSRKARVHFTDFFNVSPKQLESYGAFNISLINDLPVFIDPFLIFNSKKPEYQLLHRDMIKYIRFLRDKANSGLVNPGLKLGWFRFGEVRQNWLGYTTTGNKGTGLGAHFADELHDNLNSIFANFGDEKVTKGSHIEKLSLITDGVGRDNISDFVTNLIKAYLLEYTQTFARLHIDTSLRHTIRVPKVRFNYTTETWESDEFDLPFYDNDYVVLTPKDMLTKDEMWISQKGLIGDFDRIVQSIPNEQLRAQVANYLLRELPKEPTDSEIRSAIRRVLREHREIIEFYIRDREDTGDKAVAISDSRVAEIEGIFVDEVSAIVETLHANTPFYQIEGRSLIEARRRVVFLKQVIEDMDGYRIFYYKGKPIAREEYVQILFRLTWYASDLDINREVNNGRGPVDFKASKGAKDKALVEFKLASNTRLETNLENQVAIYERANQTPNSIKAIVYFSQTQLEKVKGILARLHLENSENVILIDARDDNKTSASKA